MYLMYTEDADGNRVYTLKVREGFAVRKSRMHDSPCLSLAPPTPTHDVRSCHTALLFRRKRTRRGNRRIVRTLRVSVQTTNSRGSG